jgi:acyl-CoA synthetase (AMP-forming)/AMP-acid ligase II/acyl carrier protein
MQHDYKNIAEYLTWHAGRCPDKAAFVIKGDKGEVKSELTYSVLQQSVNMLACNLVSRQLYGKRALMIYQDAREFIVSFLACQLAGIIPVPVPYVKGSKQIMRLTAVADDAGIAVILCNSYSIKDIEEGLGGFIAKEKTGIIPTDAGHMIGHLLTETVPSYHDISFIQYTSGSTGRPKGVIISSTNLLHNQLQIQQTFGCDEHSVILSWLPFHHDMGLIGNMLHAIYTGCTCVLLQPSHFIQNPAVWLNAISVHRATHSGGPNFAYDLCVNKIPESALQQLDLSSWQVAYNGSEPLRENTMRQFGNYFRPAGFNPASFFPCYGLAEATLLVSGTKKAPVPSVLYIDKEASAAGKIVIAGSDSASAIAVAGSGIIAAGMQVKIIAPGTGNECGEMAEGEILLAGESITKGYWNKDNSEVFADLNGTPFLRTGDLGFLKDGELFVHGRIKEMLIIRGKNFYPADMEQVAAESDNAVEKNGVAVFSINDKGGFAVVAEIKRRCVKDVNAAAVIRAVSQAITTCFGVSPDDVILTGPMGIPRTTSGKLQRTKCSGMYARNEFSVLEQQRQLAEKTKSSEKNSQLLNAVLTDADYDSVKAYITGVIENKIAGFSLAPGDDDAELTAIGLDSLAAMEVINTLNKDLSISLDAAKMLQENTLAGLVTTVENMLWLKKAKTSNKEIAV